MAQIIKKFIEDSAIDESKIKLNNDSFLVGRNNADSADVNVVKVNASDQVELGAEVNMGSFNIVTSGNVDGRDVSADGSTLDSLLDGGASKFDADQIDYERLDGSKKNIQAASDDVESSLTDLDDAVGSLAASPTNYTPSDASIVADHLAGIDSALATAGGTDFADNVFRISDDGDSSKKLSFQVAAISTSTIREITMPDADVDLGDIATNTSNISTNTSDISTLQSTISNFEWQPSALDYVVDNTAVPASEVSGDRYILSHDGGAPHANYDGASAGDIVEFDGSVWVATTPSTGTFIAADDEADKLYLWGGSSWAAKSFESTTASTGLTKSGFDIQLDSSSAGAGIAFSAGVLSLNAGDGLELNVDDLQLDLAAAGGLEIATGEAQIKVDSTGGANLAEVMSVSSNGLAVKVDDVTVEANGSGQLAAAKKSI
jgi:hypothetical protein